jgi:enamine deaminase RidA (YjgF/YER057c/UK114 family)
MTITHLNPEGMLTSPAFSQAVAAEGGRTVYVGGQNGVDAEGTMADGLPAQSAQSFRNLLTILAAAGGGPENVVKLTIHIAADADVQQAFAGSQQVWGPHPTAITVLRVAGFARPDALIEVDAVAVIDAAPAA